MKSAHNSSWLWVVAQMWLHPTSLDRVSHWAHELLALSGSNDTLRAYISTLFHLLHVNCQLHALLLLLLQPPSSSCWLLQLEWEGAKLSPCPGRTPHAAVEWDGENSSVRPEMLWTMGCLPTKVNTQTTHSCPSLKHAYTLTSTHLQYRNT